jgi:hypothetical protein
MEADAKIVVARQKKDAGDQAFKSGEVVNGMLYAIECIECWLDSVATRF